MSRDWNDTLKNLRLIGKDLENYERSVINLIASDNAYPIEADINPVYGGHIIQEGLVGRRPFAGAHLHDVFESAAIDIACDVFGAEYANLQPHSCSQANQAVYHALLNPGDTVLSLNFQAGGHLTHGLKYNFSGRHFNFVHYGVTGDGFIDYDSAQDLALKHKPKLIVCGSSSYPRLFDAQKLKKIANDVNARLMFDLSHESGLIAGGVIPNIVGYADAVTMSIDKTLRGPFGGIILCKSELADKIDKAVHPGTQSSFPVRKIASKAQSLAMTQMDDFRNYAAGVIANAKVMEHAFPKGCQFTGGTDKHYIVLNVHQAYGLNGTEAEKRLEEIGILSSRQSIPSDKSKKMSDAGGLRLGTAWLTSRGYDENDTQEVTSIITEALSQKNGADSKSLSDRVSALSKKERTNDVWQPKVGG